MGTLNPGQIFDHNLDIVKGPSLMHRLDYAAAPVADQVLFEGSVMSLNSEGKFVAGCPAGTVANRPMPVFAIQGINDFDANSDIGNMSGGVMSGVVATGGYEIKTTEFVATETYAPNDLLKAATGNDAGKVQKATVAPYGAESMVGVVTKPAALNADLKNMLSFWTVYLPANA